MTYKQVQFVKKIGPQGATNKCQYRIVNKDQPFYITEYKHIHSN